MIREMSRGGATGPCIVTHASEIGLATTLTRVFSSRSWIHYVDWAAFLTASGSADCTVVCERWLNTASTARIREARRRTRHVPMVLVTERTFENAKGLRLVEADDVVWADELHISLEGAAVKAAGSSWMRQLLAATSEAEWLSPRLRLVFRDAVAAPWPIRTVRSAATRVGCHRRTLWRDWRDAIAPDTTPKLEHCLDWLLLIRSRAAYEHRSSWSTVANDAGLDLRSLQRRAKRLCGSPLSQLAEMPPADLAQRFLSQFPRASATPTSRGFIAGATHPVGGDRHSMEGT